MLKKISKMFMVLAICNIITLGMTGRAMASPEAGTTGFSDGVYVATVEVDQVNINREYHASEVLVEAQQGDQYRILEDMGDGWLKVAVNESTGYIPQDGNTSIKKLENESQIVSTTAVKSNQRQDLVNYAMQFVGGKYSYGGNDPRTGVDCSGFTKYILQHGAGVNVSRSSQSQAGQGVSVGADQMQPGDLIFYGNGRRINHVGMYIGDGQIVHASTNRTGIKVSNWQYRQPVRIVNVIGDI